MIQELTMKLNQVHGIELSFEDKLIFTGINQELKWQIYQLFKRYSQSISYNLIEEDYFGIEGIDMKIDDKKVNLKTSKFICVDQFQDIMTEFQQSKGSLFSQHVEYLSADFDVEKQMYRLNEIILELESVLECKTREWSDTFRFHLNPIIFSDLMKKYMQFNFLKEDKEIPYYCLSVCNYLDELMRLIQFQIERIGMEIWLILYNPENFLGVEALQYLCDEAATISKKTGKLKLILFHKVHTIDYNVDEIDNIVICTEEVNQLPEYDILKGSIERNYPDQLVMSDEKLVAALNRVFEFVGSKSSKEATLSYKDMVLLKVLNRLMNCQFKFETSNVELTISEMAYLTSAE